MRTGGGRGPERGDYSAASAAPGQLHAITSAYDIRVLIDFPYSEALRHNNPRRAPAPVRAYRGDLRIDADAPVEMAQQRADRWRQPGAGPRDAARGGTERRRLRPAADWHRQHVDRDRALQLSPARSRRAREGG